MIKINNSGKVWFIYLHIMLIGWGGVRGKLVTSSFGPVGIQLRILVVIRERTLPVTQRDKMA